MTTKPELLTNIYKVIKTDKAYEIAKDVGWLDGGCWMLANAIKPLIPRSTTISVSRRGNTQIEHIAVITKDNWVIDGAGVKTYNDWVKYWENDEVDGLGDIVVRKFDIDQVPGPRYIEPFRDRAVELRQHISSKLQKRKVTTRTSVRSSRSKNKNISTGIGDMR